MVKALVLREKEGKKSLGFDNVNLRASPPPGAVLLRHTAICTSYYDLEMTRGLRPAPKGDYIPGISAAGTVERAGPGVNYKKGDRVVYIHPNGGAYTQARMIHAELLHGIPEGISDEKAAASFSRLMLAHTLLAGAFKTRKNKNILITGAAGGAGHLLTTCARHLYGANVYGTVSRKDKAVFAAKYGCELLESAAGTPQQITEEIRDLTGGEGMHAVFDGAGADNVALSMAALRPFGLYCAYGAACGKTAYPPEKALERSSIFYTRPSVFLYKRERREAVLTAVDMFGYMEKGYIKPAVTARFALQDIAKAHAFLRSREHTGTCVVVP